MSDNNATEVIIIGGGPAGLSLALHLDMHGIDTVLFEAEPTTRWHPKGNTNNARSMEIFRRLGIADDVRALGVPADHPFDIAFFTRFSAYEVFRGRTPSRDERLKQRAVAPATDQVVEPPHRANQMYLERLLFERATTRPHIKLKFGCAAKFFVPDGDGVSVTAENGEIWHSRYLVGCDGSRGLVRKSLGIKYAGEAQLMNVFLSGLFTAVHLRIPDLYPKFVGQRRAWMYMSVNRDVRLVMISLNGADEFITQIPTENGHEMDEGEIVDMVRKAIGADIPVEVLSHRTWNAGAYLVAERYGTDRAFIVGDAAHLYTPTGGYGLNMGIDDGANLSWKLAAVLRGWGGVDLPSTYETERRKAALRSSEVARNLGKSRVKAEVPAVAEEDSPAGEVARQTLAQQPFVQTHHFNLPEERDWLGVILGARYDDSPLIVSDDLPPPESLERYVPSDIPGGRAPHLWLDNGRGHGSSLFDHFGLGFTLLRFADVDVAALEMAARERGIPLKVFDVSLRDASALYARKLYLVRPDHYIAWRGDRLAEEVGELLDRMCGRQIVAHPAAL